jgi:hypothetical protein
MASRQYLAILAASGVLCSAADARADHQPVIAIPGKPGVPVIINHQNATGAVVIGDWGLYRPGHVTPTIIHRPPPPIVWPCCEPAVRPICCKRVLRRKPLVRRKTVLRPKKRHFFPGSTSPPKLGRLESDTPAWPPPTPAESFTRSWSAGSTIAPATISRPPVMVAPAIEPRFRAEPRPRRRFPDRKRR